MAQAPEIIIAVSGASELKRGGLYAPKYPGSLSEGAFEAILRAVKPFEESHSVKFIILEEGLDVAAVRPADANEVELAVERAMSRFFSRLFSK